MEDLREVNDGLNSPTFINSHGLWTGVGAVEAAHVYSTSGTREWRENLIVLLFAVVVTN